MHIYLSNGAELTPSTVLGASKYIQGVNRDTLSFMFPATSDMAALDSAFTAENCESITITGNDNTENIYKGYTIRAELTKASVEVTPATADSEAMYEQRVTVSMAQRTYAESQLAALQETVDLLVLDALTGEGV